MEHAINQQHREIPQEVIARMRQQNNDILIDHVSELDEVIGTLPRGEVVSKGFNYRVVHVFVKHVGSDKYLLQQLAAPQMRHAHTHGSSAAGFVHAGESYKHAAVRILDKELNLNVVSPAPASKFAMRDGDSLKFIKTFFIEVDTTPHYDTMQTESIAWLTPDEIHIGIKTEPHRYTPTFMWLVRQGVLDGR